jgi:hypothetical protein
MVAADLSGPVRAATPPEPKGVLTGDSRLDARVSVQNRRICLGELLEQLSLDSHARLNADDRIAPISGYEVTIVARDRSVRDVMLAVAGLYNAPPDRWFWERSEKTAPYGYTLRCSQPPTFAHEQRERFCEDWLVDSLHRLRSFFHAPRAQQLALARTSLHLAALLPPPNRTQFSLVDGLTDEDLRGVFRGRDKVMNRDDLLGLQREYVEGRVANGTGGGSDEVALRRGPGNNRSIFAFVGPEGSAVLGGIWLAADLQKQAQADWVSGGDRVPPDAVVPAPDVSATPEDLAVRNTTLPDLLFRLAVLSGKDVLFESPPGADDRRYSADFNLAGPLSEVLKRLGSQWIVWEKYRSFVLFRSADWPDADRAACTPWSMLKVLREEAHRNGGYLRSTGWLRMSELTPEQLDALSDEFPDASGVKQLQFVFSLIHGMTSEERKSISSSAGAGWGEFSAKTRQRLLALMPAATARELKIRLVWNEEVRPPSVELYYGPGSQVQRPRRLLVRPRQRTGPGG